MRRFVSLLPATMVICLFATVPAHASLAEWLDKLEALSGPGPFIQRVGVSFDFACVEGPWWKNPSRENPVPLDLAKTILAPAEDPKNPLSLTKLLREIRAAATPSPQTPAATQQPQQEATGGPRVLLLNQYKADRRATEDAFRTLILTQWWRLREELLAAKGQRAREDKVFANYGIRGEALDDPDTQLVRNSWKVNLSLFCKGDLRKTRLNFGMSAAWLATDRLPTGPSVAQSERYIYPPMVENYSPRINAFPVTATVEHTLPFVNEDHEVALRSAEIGASLGAIRFTPGGDPKRFKGFWSGPYYEARAALRPLAFVACRTPNRKCPGEWTGWDLFEIEGVVKSIASVTPQQFGAMPGMSSGHHTQWAVRAGLSIKFNGDQTPARLADAELP